MKVATPRQALPQLVLFLSLLSTLFSFPITPPIPLSPLPTSRQLRWQLADSALFLHFGPNTFTDSEWGSGRADPFVFNPPALDARQWASVASAAGFSRLVLTAKHHDGFCLWPSVYTNYSVLSSPWMNGSGDVVAEVAAAAREFGLQFGVYLSPWDRHEPCYGETLRYNEYYLAQMTELLTRYGDIQEVWLDGAKGEGEKDMEYYFQTWFELIHQLQPAAVIFSDAGPDVRWIGDEAGVAGYTSWSLFNCSTAKIGDTDTRYSMEGDPLGHDWVPSECDVSIRPGWFWHASEHPKSAIALLDIYYKSAGRNCMWILNVPPNSTGLISDEDVRVLEEFAEIRRTIFSSNLVQNVSASSLRGDPANSQFGASSLLKEGGDMYWSPAEGQTEWTIFLDLGGQTSFNVLRIEEPIQMGQRIIEFHLDALMDESWKRVANGTTVGYKRLLRFPPVEAQYLKLVVDRSRADPLISFVGVYIDTFSIRYNLSDDEPLLQYRPITHPGRRFRRSYKASVALI